MESYIFSILYKLIHFSHLLNPAIHRMGNTPNIMCPRCKGQNESQSYFIFYCKLSKITLDFISELINLKYAFSIPFKITLKTIIMGTSSPFHDGVQLNILPTLSSEILLLNWVQKKPFLRLTLSQYGKAFGLPPLYSPRSLLYTLVKLVCPLTF